ncbi:hypothetical protein NIES25_37880 [Nostoc linckia NIES-25]|nr:hypothetical protein NIES25_37880 [Nostoc linckia NIES-25]
MRPYTLRIRIFDWGGRLYRTHTSSEKLDNERAIKLLAQGALPLACFPCESYERS